MATNVEQYTLEYLSNVEGSTGLKAYRWKKIDVNNFELIWQLGKYSYLMKTACEKYAVQLLKKYPGVYIGIDGNTMKTSNKPIVEEPPVIPDPPKPPVFVLCQDCMGIGKREAFCPTCRHNTLEIVCPECGGTGKVLQ